MMVRIIGDRRRGVLTISALAVVVAGITVLGGRAGDAAAPTAGTTGDRGSPTNTKQHHRSEPRAIRIEHPVSSADTAPSNTPSPSQTTRSPSPPFAARTQESAGANDPLPASRPTTISIPAIDIRSDVISVGKTPDGKLAVPQPGPNLNKAAWFQNSPTPGQPGPSIIEGHVATDEQGHSVFFELGDLRPGDTITVTREDDRNVTFTVDRLQTFGKNKFPTMQIYGGDLGTPTLRLITCSNFDPDIGSHTGNVIVFAEMTSVKR